jgi:hypothetical protein
VYEIYTLFQDEVETPKVTKKQLQGILQKIVASHKSIAKRLVEQAEALKGRLPEEQLIKLVEEQKRSDFLQEEKNIFDAEGVTAEKLREAVDEFKADEKISMYVDELSKLAPQTLPFAKFLVIMGEMLAETHRTMEEICQSIDLENTPPAFINQQLQTGVQKTRMTYFKKHNISDGILMTGMNAYSHRLEMQTLMAKWDEKMNALMEQYSLKTMGSA